MKIKKYTNSAWTDLDKPMKKFGTYTDTATTLPLTIEASATDAIENYQVYGKTVENLADAIIEHANINSDGRIVNPGAIDPASDTFVLYIAPVVSGKTYTITTSTYDSAVVYAFYSTQPAYDAVSYNNTRTVLEGTHQATITAPITGWIAFRDYVTAPAGMIVEGSTPAPVYVPPGVSGGVGEETENLFDKNATDTNNGYVASSYLMQDNSISSNNSFRVSEYIPVEPNSDYYLSRVVTYGSSTALCFYDENKTYISGIRLYVGGEATTNITTPNNCLYIRTSVQVSQSVLETAMITKGSTVPTSYIPFGYKIPILIQSGVTENKFDKDAPYIDNARLTAEGAIIQNISDYCVTTFIAVQPNMEYSIVNFRGRFSSEGVCFYDETQNYISGIGMSTATTKKNFTTPESCKYIRLSEQKRLLSDAMITLYSEYPDPYVYIPHRYTSNYDLFIGSTQLGEDEYVDFVEQKVYKRTENIANWSKITTVAASVNVQDNTVTISSRSSSTLYPAVYFETSNGVDSLGMVNGKTYVLTYNVVSATIPSADTANKLTCLRNANNQIIVSDLKTLDEIGQHTFKFVYKTGLRLSVLLTRLQTSQCSTIVLSDFVLTELAPTDPPVPLPAISTYIGENSIDVDTQVQPEKVVCEYQGWKQAGSDGEVRYYHNGWVNTPPPAKPSWLADGYEAVLDALTAPSNYYCDLAYVENGTQMVYRVYVSTDTTCQIEHPDNYISVLQSPYSSSFRGFTTYGVRYNNGVWDVATTTSNQDRGQTAYASSATQRAILKSTITSLTNASGLTFEDYR